MKRNSVEATEKDFIVPIEATDNNSSVPVQLAILLCQTSDSSEENCNP